MARPRWQPQGASRRRHDRGPRERRALGRGPRTMVGALRAHGRAAGCSTGYQMHASAPFEAPRSDDEIVWIDLDLDFEVTGDEVELQDEAQFHDHARTMCYPGEVVRGAWSGISTMAARVHEPRVAARWVDAGVARPRLKHGPLDRPTILCSGVSQMWRNISGGLWLPAIGVARARPTTSPRAPTADARIRTAPSPSRHCPAIAAPSPSARAPSARCWCVATTVHSSGIDGCALSTGAPTRTG